MKITVPFAYRVNYKQPRQPSWSHSTISTSSVFEIEEISPSDAPVAHVLHDASAGVRGRYESDKDTVSKFHVPDGRCVVRLHDGQFYASRFPVEEIEKWRGDQEFDPFAVKIGLRNGDSEFQRTLNTAVPYDEKAVTLEDFNRVNPNAKKFTSDRAMTDRYMTMLATRFAVIEGVLYEKVGEPVLSVVASQGADSVAVFVEEALSPTLTRFGKGTWRGLASQRIRFGLDEYDRAMEVAGAWAARTASKVSSNVTVEAVDPSVVRFRGDHEYLFSAAGAAAGKFREAVRYLPESAGIAVTTAVNLLAVHDRLTPASLAAVRRMEVEMSAYFAGEHQAPKDGSDYFRETDYSRRSAFGEDWRWRMKRLTDAISHWDARDDIGFEWLDQALDALPLYDYPRRAYEVTSVADLDKVAMKWKGGMPAALLICDPMESAIVVVEDFEEKTPLAALVFDRNDLTAEPSVFGNPDPTTVDSEVVLARAYAQSARTKPVQTLSPMVSMPGL